MRRTVEERIRSFLAELSPRARALLTGAVEAAVARGETDPTLLVILAAAAPRPAGIPLPPAPDVWLAGAGGSHDLRRAFFAPLAPFLIDAPGLPSRPGRILVESAFGIWNWLEREALASEIAGAMAYDEPAAEAAAALRARVFARAEEEIAAARRVPKGILRLEAALGGEEPLKDLQRLPVAFEVAEGPAATLLAALPASIAPEPAALRAAAQAVAAAAGEKPEHLPWLYAAMVHRLPSPVLLPRLAIALAGSSSPIALAGSPHGAAIDLLVTEIEAEAARLVRDRGDRRPVAPCSAAIARFHALVHETAAILDLAKAPRWAGRLAAAKTRISAEIEREIDGAGGLVRRVLGKRGGADAPDAADLADAERALAFLAAGEAAKESLALNQSLATLSRDVGKSLSGYLDPLLNSLRRLSPADRETALPRVDAGIRLAELHFGAEYAASLRRIRAAALGPAARLARAS